MKKILRRGVIALGVTAASVAAVVSLNVTAKTKSEASTFGLSSLVSSIFNKEVVESNTKVVKKVNPYNVSKSDSSNVAVKLDSLTPILDSLVAVGKQSSFQTTEAIDAKITSVTFNADLIINGSKNLNVKLLASATPDFKDAKVVAESNISKTNDVTLNIENPEANQYYKVVFEYTKGMIRTLSVSDICFNTNVYNVTFDYNDGTKTVVKTNDSLMVEEPEAPVKDDKFFFGWFNGSEKFDFNQEIKANTVLTAKWVDKTPEALLEEVDSSFDLYYDVDYEDDVVTNSTIKFYLQLNSCVELMNEIDPNIDFGVYMTFDSGNMNLSFVNKARHKDDLSYVILSLGNAFKAGLVKQNFTIQAYANVYGDMKYSNNKKTKSVQSIVNDKINSGKESKTEVEKLSVLANLIEVNA